ncbi:allergenic cerato-platanin Asp F13 [Aspergillus undulatus]|uniref:allergenic cerato-platanin Asp F13 n=1 Tax=Aspergillus undulatus TaxID=1810928 RepID=UPI003CCD1D83
MKFTTTLAALLPALALAGPSKPQGFERISARQTTGSTTLSYDPNYDVGTNSLNTVVCSGGDFGLLTEGYTDFQSLPSFPRIGGAPPITGYNSPKCGSCYQVTWNSATGATNSIIVTGIDQSTGGFNVGRHAMDELTGNRAVELGRIDVTWTEVAREQCGLAARP